MGVYFGLICLLLACHGVSAQSPTCDYGTTLSAQPMTVTPLVTKELVFTCTVVNTGSCFFNKIYTIAFINVVKTSTSFKEVELAGITESGTWISPNSVFDTETITGHITAHNESETGSIQLSISYPTLQQIQSYALTHSTVCRVRGDNNKGVHSNDERSIKVHIKDHTFQGLGGVFEVNTINIKPLLTETLTVTCNVDGFEAVKTVNEVSIVKDGVIVATKARGHSPPTNTSNFPNATIEGDLRDSSGYLIATVNYPKKVHSGSFECMIKVDNPEDREVVATSDAVNIDANDPNFKDLIHYAHQLDLENNGQESQIEKLNEETKSNTDDISDINIDQNKQDERIKKLKDKTDKGIKELTDKQNGLVKKIEQLKQIRQGHINCEPGHAGSSGSQDIVTVPFDFTYERSPKVFVALKNINMADQIADFQGYTISAIDVTNNNFRLLCGSNAYTNIYTMEVFWIAFPQ